MLYSQQVQTKKQNTKDRETETEGEKERETKNNSVNFDPLRTKMTLTLDL